MQVDRQVQWPMIIKVFWSLEYVVMIKLMGQMVAVMQEFWACHLTTATASRKSFTLQRHMLAEVIFHVNYRHLAARHQPQVTWHTAPIARLAVPLTAY